MNVKNKYKIVFAKNGVTMSTIVWSDKSYSEYIEWFDWRNMTNKSYQIGGLMVAAPDMIQILDAKVTSGAANGDAEKAVPA
jgi:hypothetical protein